MVTARKVAGRSGPLLLAVPFTYVTEILMSVGESGTMLERKEGGSDLGFVSLIFMMSINGKKIRLAWSGKLSNTSPPEGIGQSHPDGTCLYPGAI